MKRTIHRMPQVMPSQPVRVEKKRSTRSMGLALVAAGIIGFIYWFIFLGPTFRITSVEVTGVTHESIQALAERFQGTNIFRMKEAAVEGAMKQAYPPVGSVRLVRGLPHKVRLEVALRTPAIRWQVGEINYVVDMTGQVFEQGEKPEYATLPKVVDKSGVSINLGQNIVSPAFITFLKDVHEQVSPRFKRNHLANEITETTFHVDVLLDGDLRLRLTTQRPLSEQLDAATAIASKHPEAKLIDVRVPKWGYWK